MGTLSFAYVGVLGLLIGSLFGPIGAFFGLLAGMVGSALIRNRRTEMSRQIAELEQRVSELETDLDDDSEQDREDR